jgi:hypothetical protein
MVEERHRKSIYNFPQLSYDPHEWDYDSWSWTGRSTLDVDSSPAVD